MQHYRKRYHAAADGAPRLESQVLDWYSGCYRKPGHRRHAGFRVLLRGLVNSGRLVGFRTARIRSFIMASRSRTAIKQAHLGQHLGQLVRSCDSELVGRPVLSGRWTRVDPITYVAGRNPSFPGRKSQIRKLSIAAERTPKCWPGFVLHVRVGSPFPACAISRMQPFLVSSWGRCIPICRGTLIADHARKWYHSALRREAPQCLVPLSCNVYLETCPGNTQMCPASPHVRRWIILLPQLACYKFICAPSKIMCLRPRHNSPRRLGTFCKIRRRSFCNSWGGLLITALPRRLSRPSCCGAILCSFSLSLTTLCAKENKLTVRNNMPEQVQSAFSSLEETRRVLALIVSLVTLPKDVETIVQNKVSFTAKQDLPYFPIPFKETETTAGLKAIEAAFALALQSLKTPAPHRQDQHAHRIIIDHEKTTAFLFQAYLARVGPFGKLQHEAKRYLKDTDLLQAQSDPYRRMSANLYETRDPGQYYHIHGSLEASTTLAMIGLEPFRSDLATHAAIVDTIESRVKKFSVTELEALNLKYKEAGIPALKYEEFLRTPHVSFFTNRCKWKLAGGKIRKKTTETDELTVSGEIECQFGALEGRQPGDSNTAVSSPLRPKGAPRACRHQGLRALPYHCRANCWAHPGRVRCRRFENHESSPERCALLSGGRQHGQTCSRSRPQDSRGTEDLSTACSGSRRDPGWLPSRCAGEARFRSIVYDPAGAEAWLRHCLCQRELLRLRGRVGVAARLAANC